MLKQRVARKMRKRKKGREGQLALGFEQHMPRAFWQARFYDFNVYSRGKMQEKLNYMHGNPVICGLVKHPKDWVWSSWARYTKGEAGLIDIDPV